MVWHFRKGNIPAFSVFTFFILAGAILAILSAPSARAEDDPVYGPRFEIGGGVGYASEKLPPRWASNYYKAGQLTGTVRLFKGLAVQGGLDLGLGGKSLSDSVSCGEYIVKINKNPFSNSRWAGIRYEIPMSVLHQDIAGIQSIYGAAGFTWSEFGVQSTEWVYKGNTQTQEKPRGFRLADINGPYAILAARWRIDNPESKGRDTSWFGSYGLDFGVRYNRYSQMTPAYPNIAKVTSDFSSSQVFMVGFIKFRLFE